MTAAMFDEITDREKAQNHNAALLRPGTLVFLWRPGDQAWTNGAQPVVARVKSARRDNIEAIDIRDGGELLVDVAHELTDPARLRWTWEVAAAPEKPAVKNGIEQITPDRLTIADRIALACGDAGANVRVGLKSGASIHGALTTVVLSADPAAVEPDWALFTGPTDARGPIRHWVRVCDIECFTRSDG